MLNRRLALLSALATAGASAVSRGAFAASGAAPDPALVALVNGPQRTAANRARDPWRHPVESLTFWELKPSMVVVDIVPGGGYWTEIVAPYVAHGGGRYIAGMTDPSASEGAKKAEAAFAAKYADPAIWGQIGFTPFGAGVGFSAPASSVDFILYSRFIHDLMWTPGLLDKAVAGFHAALRPGGVLAVEEHRADPRPMIDDAHDGYVSTAFVVDEMRKGGFAFEASSEINANPKDTKDYPFGVWTLPPTRRTSPQGQPPDPSFDRTHYDAIGESDRMTLRFRKLA